MSDNFQDSTLTTFKIQQLSTFNFDNLVSNIWQLSTFDNFQLSTFNFDNLVSNMQF